MSGKYATKEVFTPATQAKLTFVERDAVLNNYLVDALSTIGMQIVVYGHSGTGKSTLLTNKINQLYDAAVKTSCTISTKFEHLILDAFDQLEAYYTSGITKKKKIGFSAQIEKDFQIIKGQIDAGIENENETTVQRILPPQLTINRLAKMLGILRCCWVVDDFHKLTNEEKTKFAQCMKLFVDMSVEYPELKIIAIGASGTAREVIKHDSNINNRVAQILVKPLKPDELNEILIIGEKLLNVYFPEDIKRKVVAYSNGVGSICHQLALNMCFHRNVLQTAENKVIFTDADFLSALTKYVETSSDTLRARYEKAIKIERKQQYRNHQEILDAMLRINKEFISHHEILKAIKKIHPHYPAGNLSLYLKKLQEEKRGAIVAFNSDNNSYYFSDPFIKTYIQIVNSNKKSPLNDRRMSRSIVDIKELTKKILEEFIRNQYLKY